MMGSYDDPALRDSADSKIIQSPATTSNKHLHQHHDEPLKKQTSVVASSDVSETTASESDDEQPSAVAAAKENLKALLKKHDRSAKHPEVVQAIEELAALNPTGDAARAPYLEGRFVALTRPEFPGRIKQPEGRDVDQYTLGRLSFNIFQPNNLVCTIVETRNELIEAPLEEEGHSSDVRRFAYPLITAIIIHTDKGDFPATICMDAVGTTEKQPKNRLGVTFAGGTLTPAEEVRSDPDQLELWKEVFADAYKKAEEQRSYLSSVFQYIFKWVFQLTTPKDEDAEKSETHSVSFQMKRCPHGYFDILYVDEDMRITKGNRGTVVIVERMKE